MSKPAERLSVVNSGGFSDVVLDPAQCSRLSLQEKRELVREIAKGSRDAPRVLSSFTCRELLEIICAEMGKERKYSGYTKLKMIEHLLRLVSQKSMGSPTDNVVGSCPARAKCGTKRRRQKKTRLLVPTDSNAVSLANVKEESFKIQVCQNASCRSTLSPGDAFCKRCSCCICHYYDDNKDPSLWLTCGSDSPGEQSCGHTCHLICVLKDERTGIIKSGCRTKLDGSFYCVSCGKINVLMRSWRKQLLVAKEARRVDALCQRVLLCHRILTGTEQYKELHEILETALEMLKNELGPLDLVCAKMARGIVNRLSCGAEVQKLCISALEAFDSLFTDRHPCFEERKESPSCKIQFEESSPTATTIVLEYVDSLFKDLLGCMLWHRKCSVKDYPDQPTYIVLKPEKRFKITDLCPSTGYLCKVSLFSSEEILGVWEAKWSTPASNGSSAIGLHKHGKEDDATITKINSQVKTSNDSDVKLSFGRHSIQLKSVQDVGKNKDVSLINCKTFSPSTPSKPSGMLAGCKKQIGEGAYEYSVRVIKWLEHEGHIDEDFRVKFLTWFSLKATMKEKRVVNVFVDTLVDDPSSLAGQLTHAFVDEICCEKKPVPQHGLCTQLWH